MAWCRSKKSPLGVTIPSWLCSGVMLQSARFCRLTKTSVRRRRTPASNFDGMPYSAAGIARPGFSSLSGIGRGAAPATRGAAAEATRAPPTMATLSRRNRRRLRDVVSAKASFRGAGGLRSGPVGPMPGLLGSRVTSAVAPAADAPSLALTEGRGRHWPRHLSRASLQHAREPSQAKCLETSRSSAGTPADEGSPGESAGQSQGTTTIPSRAAHGPQRAVQRSRRT